MPNLPIQPPSNPNITPAKKAKKPFKHKLKFIAWSLVALLIVSEGINLLLPFIPINDWLCKTVQNATYKETGLWVSANRIDLQWHLWEGVTIKLKKIKLLPTKAPIQASPTYPLWEVDLEALSLGVDIYSLVFNNYNGAIYKLESQSLTLKAKGKPGLENLQATLKRITEKPSPPNAPRWIEQLNFDFKNVNLLLLPPIKGDCLSLALPAITGKFKQVEATDPFNLTISQLKIALVMQKKNTQKQFASFALNGLFSLPVMPKKTAAVTPWQGIWLGLESLKKVNFSVDSNDSSTLIAYLLKQGVLSENPLKKTTLLPESMKLKGEITAGSPQQWAIALSGSSTLFSQPIQQKGVLKPNKVAFNTVLDLTKKTQAKAQLAVKAFQFRHIESHAILQAQGVITLTEQGLKAPNKLPLALNVSGDLPNIQHLPYALKNIRLSATKTTQALQANLLSGSIKLNKLNITGTVNNPSINQLETHLNQLKLQATTQGHTSPMVQTSGAVTWLKTGKIAGQFNVMPHGSIAAKPTQITLTRTVKTKPINIQVTVPRLGGSIVSAWQPWVINYLSPSLKKAPPYQWKNFSWQGETSLSARATYQPSTQKINWLNAEGSLNQWQASLHNKPWVVTNGSWHWHPANGFKPQLQVTLANNSNPLLTVGGKWHPKQANSTIALTLHKAKIQYLVKQGLSPLNQYFLPPALQLSEVPLNQWLADPSVKPWLQATFSSQATLSSQRLALQHLTLEGLGKTGKATIKALVPWQAFSNHTTVASASVTWQAIPLAPFPLAFKQALSQATLKLEALTGETNGSLTWAGTMPKSVLATDFESPKRLTWLRPLTGDIAFSAIEGQLQQHPIPFQISPIQLRLKQLALSHQSPLKVTWGPASLLGNLGISPTANQHWQPLINLALAPIPLETLKTNRAFYEPILKQLKQAYPTFWRTAGTIAGDVNWDASSGNAPRVQLHLANAGFYIPRTFAPLHGITSTFKVDILKRTLSLPEPLFVQLGNSTIMIPWLNLKSTGSQLQLNLQAQGRLHPRELNSLLGNNWYFQPTQYPWLADSWLGLNATWGGDANHPKSNIEANLSSVLQSEGEATKQAQSPLAEETTAKALVAQLGEAEKTSPLPQPSKPILSVLSPSKLAWLNQKSTLGTTNTLYTGVPKLLTMVESSAENNVQDVVWYQKLNEKQPLKELARYPLSMGNQPLATLVLQFKGKMSQPRLALGELRMLGRSEPLRFQATLDAPAQPTHLWSNQGRIWTDKPIELPALAPHTTNPTFRFESGKLASNLYWQQADSNPLGQLQLNGIQSVGLGIDNLEANAQFKASKLDLTVQQFKAGGSDVSLAGNADLPQPLPVAFNQLNVTGKTFYVEGFLGLLEKLTAAVMTPYKQGLPPTVRWVPERTISLPIQVETGSISLEEAIVNNILATNYNSQWQLFPNGYMALEKMAMNVAGGTVKGQLSVSPSQRNAISLKIDADHVKANALAKALLNAPNQVFGDLTGGIDFATHGFTPVALIQHANGKTNFVIAEGRVPALDKVERLLSTANVVRGGVLGFNFNNLAFAIKGGLKAGEIRAISGDFQVVDGQLLTRNFLSDSKNLDLAMAGGVRLDNGLADLTIIGIMPQNVTGKGFFGKLGDFSLGKAFKYVPVLGYIPLKGGNKKGVFDFIPGLGYVPGLGGVPGKTNSFEALLKGPPDDPTSIKSIRWLRAEKVVEPTTP